MAPGVLEKVFEPYFTPKDVPILLCTGHSDTIDKNKAKELGIRGFAIKPLDKGKLARAVRMILDKNHGA